MTWSALPDEPLVACSTRVNGSRGPYDDDPTRPATAADGGQLKLMWVRDGAVVPLPLGTGGIVGRGAEADLRIDDESLSRRHARVTLGDGNITVVDLGSTNGVWVRGKRLAPNASAQLFPGDSLRLGDALLLLHHAAVIDRLGQAVAPGAGRAGEEERLFGQSLAAVRGDEMRDVYRVVDQIAVAPISVLLLGETGVGKEVLARAIHERSNRRAGPFIPVNCPALPESLAESELFGHEKGAFTGADGVRAGLLESANGGTVFLDEIGDLPLAIQAKLLRLLEDRQLARVGGKQPRALDARFVAATNRDIEGMCDAGEFRRDLYFRLAGVELCIPPLRERKGEIEPLARHFLASYCRVIGRAQVPALTPEAVQHLRGHSWPGNIRELRNAIERAVLLCGGEPIRPEHLPLRGRPPERAAPAPEPTTIPASSTLNEQVEQLEKQRIVAALEACAGNQSRAAAMLGISRRGLSLKLDRYDIKRPRR